MKSALEDWAVLAPKSASGFGRQAEDLKRLLGIRHHIIADYDNLANQPPATEFEFPMPKKSSRDDLDRELVERRGIRGIVFFERSGWIDGILPYCRERGIRTVCVPNWEWFRREDPNWSHCDFFACPSPYTFQLLLRFGFLNCAYVPWALDLASLPRRAVAGPARHFVHNAGIVDVQDRKATLDTIAAFARTRNPDIRLTVRAIRDFDHPPIKDPRISLKIGELDSPADLWLEGDVAIQPSKLEGLGFMVLEPAACGIPTITTDFPPMSDHVPYPQLLVRPNRIKRKAFSTQWVKHVRLRIPNRRALADRIEWCASNDLAPLAAALRALHETRFDAEILRASWMRILQAATPAAAASSLSR